MLRECVNSGILTGYSTEKLLKTLMNIEPLFSHVKLFSEFDTLLIKYIKAYGQVTKSPKGSIGFPLKSINLYSAYKVPAEDIKELYKAICEINESAKKLFGDATVDEQFEFGNHFRRLRDFVSSKQSTLADEEEKDLITRLLVRLEVVQNQLNLDGRKGTLDDLRSGLYYFLKQKEEPLSDWFVKNFEQIDGDVLLSSKQNVPGREKVYHFACVSDKDMNHTVDELLPWPLSELFIEKAYTPKDLPFQVYYAALGERSKYLRYALFYGLYFSQCKVKISFVKRYGNDTTDYYELLRLIGLKSNSSEIFKEDVFLKTRVPEEKEVPKIVCNQEQINQEQMAAMFFCPYRFLLDYVINSEPIFTGKFLLERFFVNVLIDNTWKSIEGKNQVIIAKNIKQYINQETNYLINYFPFFSAYI